MALTFYWNCEAADFSADNAFDSPYTGSCYSAGDDTAAANGTVSLDAAAAKQGSTGILVNALSERYSFDPSGIISKSVGCVGAWVRFSTSMLTSGQQWFFCRGASSNDYIGIESVSNHTRITLVLRNSTNGRVDLSTASGTVDADMVADTWYFIVARWNIPNDYRRIEVYNSSMTLIQHHTDSSTDIAAYEPADFATGGLRFGDCTGWGGSRVGHFDNIFIASNHDEPLQDYADITSYQDYGVSAPTITDVGDEQFYHGETGVVITGTGFGATQGGSTVTICATDSFGDASATVQTITSWSDTSITITVNRGSLIPGVNLYLFAENAANEHNAAGHVVQFYLRTPVVPATVLRSQAASAAGSGSVS